MIARLIDLILAAGFFILVGYIAAAARHSRPECPTHNGMSVAVMEHRNDGKIVCSYVKTYGKAIYQ